jgi:hypothetical protein
VGSRQNGQRKILLIMLIAFVALTGFTAGIFTRAFISTNDQSQLQKPDSSATATLTLAPQLSPTDTQQPTEAPALAHFALKLTATPSSGHVGDTIVISVLATDDATGTPIPGLTCRLRAPSNGDPGLMTDWPTPTATNTDGIATWTVKIPQNAPGRYEIEAFAQTPSWSYVVHTAVIVTAS